ncbi:DUF3592 domain-containing protein [Rubrivirga sp.]|uniref:DUF3592 domain-containing protein n=1 Tax=Rubrivirga sp. TaxID=1885344 RepID=UPI003C791860
MTATSSPPVLDDDEIPVRQSDTLVWDVAAARRAAGVTIPKWMVGVGIAALVGVFVVGWAAAVTAVGVVAVGVTGQGIRRAIDSRHWPTVGAVTTGREIRESRIETYEEERKRTVARKTYTPVASYEYVVDGETYAAVSLEDGESSYKVLYEAERALRRDFPTGVPVTVWYDPADPFNHTRHGAAIRRAVRQSLGLGLTGLAFLVVGVLLMF